MSRNLRVATVLAVLAVIGSPAMAHETSADATPTLRVAYGDLDLSTSQGQARLDARLRRAAAEVCDVSSVRKSLDLAASSHACMDRAITGARETLASAGYRRGLSR